MASIPTIVGVGLVFVIAVFPNVNVGSYLDNIVFPFAVVGTLNVDADSLFAI